MNMNIELDAGPSIAHGAACGGGPDESDQPDEWGLRPSGRAYEAAERERLACMPERQRRERRMSMLKRLPSEFAADVTALFEDVRRMVARALRAFRPFLPARAQMSRAKRHRRTGRLRRAASTAAGSEPDPSEPAPLHAADATAHAAAVPSVQRPVNDRDVVILVPSPNAKLGPVCASTIPIAHTCPNSCQRRDRGCYVQSGYVGGLLGWLTRAAEAAALSSLDDPRAVARLIREAAGRVRPGTLLRLHVAGDARTAAAVGLLAEASATWPGPVCILSYASRKITQRACGYVSVLASGERVEDVLRPKGGAC